MKGSATWFISMADCTRVCTPFFSSASCKARALITVANMPIWSAETRSMSFACCGDAAKEISATHDDGDLDVEGPDVGQFRSNLMNSDGVDAEALARGQCLTGQLEKDSLEDSIRHEVEDTVVLRVWSVMKLYQGFGRRCIRNLGSLNV